MLYSSYAGGRKYKKYIKGSTDTGIVKVENFLTKILASLISEKTPKLRQKKADTAKIAKI